MADEEDRRNLIQNGGNNEDGDQKVAIRNPTCFNCSRQSRKIASLVWFLFCFLLGVVFLVAGKVKTDENALSIDGKVIYRFLTVSLIVSIIWMSLLIFQKGVKHHLARFVNWEKHMEPHEPLLPRRLLVGVMFFGLGSSFMTMVEFLEYMVSFDCPSRDPTYIIYYFTRTMFTYIQLYFLYKLTTNRKKLLFHGHFLVMQLIAVNLITWLVTFIHDSAEELESLDGEHSQNSTYVFMLYHYGVNISAENSTDSCLKEARDLEATAKTMEPYFYTFTMEYCLITAGLLFNVWLSLTGPAQTVDNNHNGGESDAGSDIESYEDVGHNDAEAETHEVGTLWRFGLVLGMVCVPIFAAIIFNIVFTDTEEEDKLIYISFQFFFFILILAASAYGTLQLKNQDPGATHSKVDFYLLGAALVGVLFLDLFILISAFCEVNNYTSVAVLLIFTNSTEILCSIVFTQFVYEALQRQLPKEKSDTVLYSAGQIRQVVSFLFMLNICFWVMYTFEVKKSSCVLSLTEQFFTKKIWFYIAHIVYPLAVFFHFHGAVCMVEILDTYSKVPVKTGVQAAKSQKDQDSEGQSGQGQQSQGQQSQGQQSDSQHDQDQQGQNDQNQQGQGQQVVGQQGQSGQGEVQVHQAQVHRGAGN